MGEVGDWCWRAVDGSFGGRAEMGILIFGLALEGGRLDLWGDAEVIFE